ncbi:MAG: 7-cyano-7-deazaguanine synthase [Candidatus Peribacteraceae bacterium]|nr:7-cyano-7-deazaguanine synthase [Candidatus Peribacteraceae bacterium]
MSDTPKKITILYSGGLDSYLMYHWAKIHQPTAEVECIFYQHGQESEQAEIDVLPDFVKVRKIDWLGKDIQPVAKKSDPFAGAIYIPGRNLVFGVLAACQSLPDEIWMGTVWDEDNQQATDKNDRFKTVTSSLISYVLSPFTDAVEIKFPFVEAEMTKEDLVRWALTNGITKEQLINDTVSCWNQVDDKPCGACKQCTKRMLVFGLNGFSEPYNIHPMKSVRQQKNMMAYIQAAIDHPNEQNRDEANMVDMIVRYFDLLPMGLSTWEFEMRRGLINKYKRLH